MKQDTKFLPDFPVSFLPWRIAVCGIVATSSAFGTHPERSLREHRYLPTPTPYSTSTTKRADLSDGDEDWPPAEMGRNDSIGSDALFVDSDEEDEIKRKPENTSNISAVGGSNSVAGGGNLSFAQLQAQEQRDVEQVLRGNQLTCVLRVSIRCDIRIKILRSMGATSIPATTRLFYVERGRNLMRDENVGT